MKTKYSLQVLDYNFLFCFLVFQMEDEIVELEIEVEDQPWCSSCSDFTDYRRKWTSVTRGDLDGRVYAENLEIPSCIICGSEMHFLKSSKILVRFTKMISLLCIIISSLVCFYLFDATISSTLVWVLLVLLSVLILKLPKRAKKALDTHDAFIHAQKLKVTFGVMSSDNQSVDR